MAEESHMKTFWIMFLYDPTTKLTSGSIHQHNCTADYKRNPYFVGSHKIELDMRKLNNGK